MERLKVYWFGYGGSSWLAEKYREMIEDRLGMSLITIHEHPNANIPWKLETVYKELSKADIIIIPANFRRQPCKSNNRLTQAMALGKPVICDPMPAYKNIINNGINGFITKNGEEEEWFKYLLMLRDSPQLRKEMGIEAKKTSDKYSLKNITNNWVQVLAQLDNPNIDNKNKIDVIIPTKNNIPILSECLKSFSNSTLEETIYIIDNSDSTNTDLNNLMEQLNLNYEIRNV